MNNLKPLEVDTPVKIRSLSGDTKLRIGSLNQGGVHTIINDDYEALRNQPMIESNVLIGDKTFEELGLNDITPQDIDEMMFGG